MLKTWKRLFFPAVSALLFTLSLKTAMAGYSAGLAAYQVHDYATALAEFVPLAKRGDARAQRYLGIMYRRGQGVEPNIVAGTNWLYKAAQQGFAPAQFDLGVVFKNMAITKSQYARAVKWLTAASLQGHVEAKFHLGQMYRDGDGVEPDNRKALVLLNDAAKKVPAARGPRDQLKKRMTKEEISQARAMGMTVFKEPPKLKDFIESREAAAAVKGACGVAGSQVSGSSGTLSAAAHELEICVGDDWGGTLCVDEINQVNRAFQDLNEAVLFMKKNC